MALTLIAVAPEAEPNADATVLRVPEGLDLGPRWVDHERAVASYVPEEWFLCAVTQEYRERDTCFHMSWLHAALYDYAWPPYKYVEVGAARALARDMWSIVARRCGMYDPARKLVAN
jgi:hypothetical protein